MSTVSDTDLKLFLELGNPENMDAQREDDDEEEEEGEDEYDDESEGEEDAEPDLTTPAQVAPRAASSVTRRSKKEETIDEEPEFEDEDESELEPVPPMSKEDMDYQRTTVLLELDRLKAMGCKLTREYTMDDSLEEMEYEAKRHVLQLEEQNNVNTLKDGLRLFVSGCEFANSKFGPFLNLDGFSQSVSNDLNGGKYNLTLSKLHRKYFKNPGQSSPEMELAFSLLGAAAFHHFQRSYMQKIMPGTGHSMPHAASRKFPPPADDDSDEDLPPNFRVGG